MLTISGLAECITVIANVCMVCTDVTDIYLPADPAGVRIPESDFIRSVCRGFGGAIALTSANSSGGTSPLSVNDFMHLWPQCAAVFNGKRIQADRAGSTIVDLSAPGMFKIVRQGISLKAVTGLLLQQGLTEKA